MSTKKSTKPATKPVVKKAEPVKETVQVKTETAQPTKTETVVKSEPMVETMRVDERPVTIENGEVTVDKPKKTAAKKPATSPKKAAASPKKAAARSPRKTASKSPKKVAKSPNKKKSAVKPTKPVAKRRRINPDGKNLFESQGICIAPARVKKVLYNSALHPEEYAVIQILQFAENKPTTQPTKEQPVPTPTQGEQYNVEDLSPINVSRIIDREIDRIRGDTNEELNPTQRRAIAHLEMFRGVSVARWLDVAEREHQQALLQEYARSKLDSMRESNPAERERYAKALEDARRKFREANRESENASDKEFSVENFNRVFDAKFYDDFKHWCTQNDHYNLEYRTEVKDANGKGTGTFITKYNQWSRAAQLVSKIRYRMSQNTCVILAAFLDNVVKQYVTYGVLHCLGRKARTVNMYDALDETADMARFVPLRRFVSSLPTYHNVAQWFDKCQKHLQEVRDARAKGLTVENSKRPNFPEPNYDKDFGNFVGNICKSVCIELAKNEKKKERADLFLSTSISRDFKQFCSNVVYEIILRVGRVLNTLLSNSGVKTVSDELLWTALSTVMNVVGLTQKEMQSIKRDMDERLARNKVWRTTGKHQQKAAESNDDNEEETQEPESDAEEEEEEEDAEEDAEDEEVEVTDE